jgi:CubicO group peptidase (beta-lactamase class C family)
VVTIEFTALKETQVMQKFLLLLFFIADNVVTGQIPVDSIRAIIKREVAARRGKSIIVGIVDSTGNRQIFAEGIISDNDSRKPDGSTLYEIGSITKVFTSLLLADMSLNHQLSVNDPISKYLAKNIRVPSLNGKEISLLSLSTHRSGMPRFPYNVDPKNIDEPYADYTAEKLYEYISNFQPPDIDTVWRYSNVGYGLLGLILEKIAQKNYETLVTQKICKPLNMGNTVILMNAQQTMNAAVGHAETGTYVGFTDLGAISAGGALRSNINDLLTFAEANLGLIQTDLFPAMQLTHILQAKKDGINTYTTMGWTLTNDNGSYLLFKDGGMPGFRSFLGIDKINKIGVVVLCNSNNSVTDIGRHILDSNRMIEPYQYPWALLDTMRATIHTAGVNAAIDLYFKLKNLKNTPFIFNETELNYLGNELRKSKKIKDAIKIYELNAKEYPQTTLVYENLAETYRRNNNKRKAKEYFEQARALDSQNPHFTYVLERIDKY